MTEADRKTLLVSVCSHIPHGVRGRSQWYDKYLPAYPDLAEKHYNVPLFSVVPKKNKVGYGVRGSGNGYESVDDMRMWLYPVRNLTEDECDEIYDLVIPEGEAGSDDWIKFRQDGDIWFIFDRRGYRDVKKLYDWLYEHHYDVDGLIGKGLALDATGLGIYDNVETVKKKVKKK